MTKCYKIHGPVWGIAIFWRKTKNEWKRATYLFYSLSSKCRWRIFVASRRHHVQFFNGHHVHSWLISYLPLNKAIALKLIMFGKSFFFFLLLLLHSPGWEARGQWGARTAQVVTWEGGGGWSGAGWPSWVAPDLLCAGQQEWPRSPSWTAQPQATRGCQRLAPALV